MCDMLSAVRYLHEQGIAHRDLKLENFLFEQPGMHSPLKLIDFGLSKHFDEKESMHQVVGSAYYTAPEVLGGNYDFKCDIWSLVSIGLLYVHALMYCTVQYSGILYFRDRKSVV